MRPKAGGPVVPVTSGHADQYPYLSALATDATSVYFVDETDAVIRVKGIE
jgi:hypothetical protein